MSRESTHGRPLHILLVEDDDVDREFVARLLTKYDRPVTLAEAASLAEAREVLNRGQFDCVLLDYHLQGDSGLDLVPNILMHRPKICPVILVTLHESESIIVEAMHQGVADYIGKANLSVEKLRTVIERAVERAETEQADHEAKLRLQELTEKARREDAERLQRHAEETERLANAKSMFVANMSHEIRTPLNAVIGLSYLLQRTALSSEQTVLVERIKLASKSLLQIVNNVLDLSKLGGAALKLEKAPFNLRHTLQDLIGLVGVQVGGKKLALELRVAGELPLIVAGDPVRLHQVLGNLLTNAVKFTPDGSVQLHVTLASRVGRRARIRFEVRDTGIGIAPEVLPLLFRPFAQADASTTRRYGGTGLGLSIARELVLLMGGEIGAVSQPGEGCTFWFEAEFDEAEDLAVASISKTISAGAPRLSGVKVLLVDDSEVNVEVGKVILECEGALVETACNGREAVQLVLARPKAFDIVLMDLQMPVLDGYNAFRRIAAVLGADRPVIVALTAGSITDTIVDVSASGMDGLMHKPFDVDELVHWIRARIAVSDGTAAAKSSKENLAWPAIPGIDPSLSRAQMGDNRMLFNLALKTFARQYENVEGLLASDDLKEIGRIMHRLKGSAATIGAQTLRDLALRTEAACKANVPKEAAAALLLICEQFKQLRSHIADLLKQSEARSAA